MKKIIYIIPTVTAIAIVYLLSGFIEKNTSADRIPETFATKHFSPTQYMTAPKRNVNKKYTAEEMSRYVEISNIENKYIKKYKFKVKNCYLIKPKYSYKKGKFKFKDYYKIDIKGSTKFKIALWITKYKPKSNGDYKKISERIKYGKLYHAKKNIYYVKYKSKTPIIGHNIKVKKKGKKYYVYNKNKKIKQTKYIYRITTYIEADPIVLGRID